MHLLLPPSTYPLSNPVVPLSSLSNPKSRNPNISSIHLRTEKQFPSDHTSQSLQQLNLQHDWLHLLQTCIQLGDVGLGLSIHAYLKKFAMNANAFHGNNLIHMYSKFNMLDAAQQVFDEMPMRNTISWTSLISGYSSANDSLNVLKVSRSMHDWGEKFNEYTCSCILNSVKDLVFGKQIHALAAKVGTNTNVIVCTALISMYASNGSIEEMELVFSEMIDVDTRCLNSLILEYKKIQNWEKTILAFRYLLETGLHPNAYTFTNTFSACDEYANLNEGKQVHGLAIKSGAFDAISVGNAAILMYGKHGLVAEAENAFGAMSDKNLVSWTSILSIRAKTGFLNGVIDGFVKILELGVAVDSHFLSTVLDACSHCKDFKFVSMIHAFVCKLGYASDNFVGTALIDAYSKSGGVKELRLFFYRLPNPKIESFNAILDISSESFGIEDEIMVILNTLRSIGLKPDAITFSRLLRMSADQTLNAHGKAFHAYVIKSGFDKVNAVSNAVISMYGKCGFIDDACTKFNEMIERDIVTWNAIISTHAIHGQAMKAFLLYKNMIKERIQPDEITAVSILQACSHSGFLDEGITVYQKMQEKYGIVPTMEHHVSLVDLLGRLGDLEQAMEFIKQSEFRDEPHLWRSMVNACRLCSDLELGKVASKHLIDLAPHDSASFVLVANLYLEGGKFEEAAKVRVAMRDRELKKEAGYSWISFGREAHGFIADGRDHPQIKEIQEMLVDLHRHSKEFEEIYEWWRWARYGVKGTTHF